MSLELEGINLKELKEKIIEIENLLERVQNLDELIDKVDEIERRIARIEIRLNLPTIEKLKRKIKGEQMIKSIQRDE